MKKMARILSGLSSDRFLFLTGHIGIFMLVGLTLYANTVEKDVEVICWTPSHFMAAHVEYTNAICEYEEHRYVPPSHDNTSSLETSKSKSSPYWYYVIEAVLICMSYFMLSSITTSLKPSVMALKAGLTGMHQIQTQEQSLSKENTVVYADDKCDHHMSSHTMSVTMMSSYLLVKLFTSSVWMIQGIRSLTFYSAVNSPIAKNHTFYCDFDIRQLRQIHRYTVQCVEDDEEEGIMKSDNLLFLNMSLCFMMAAMNGTHILNLMLCGTRTAKDLYKMSLSKKEEMMRKDDFTNDMPAVPCCLSDAVLIAAVANDSE